MKLVSTLAIASLAVLAFASSLKSEIAASEAKASAALSKGDMEKFKALMKPRVTADFKYVEEGKEISFDQMCDQMIKSIGAIKGLAATSSIKKLTESGSTATVVVNRGMSWKQKGQDGKDHVMKYTGVTTDSYKKVDGKWLVSKMVWSDTKLTVDGKAPQTGGAGK